MTIYPGMPRKVLRRANEHGVHMDCLVAGNLCPSCHAIVMEAFDFFYGDSKNESEVITAIIEDFRRDQIADERGQ